MATKNKYLHLQQEQEYEVNVRKNFQDVTTIGKNVFLKRFTQYYTLDRFTLDILNRNFIKFEKINENQVKIGVQGDYKAEEDFVACFTKYLIESSMLGFFFVGITTPFLKDLLKVDFSRLNRLELVNCRISNIQPLTWINTPHLKSLFLLDNCITNLKPIQKLRQNEFNSIDLENNPIKQFTPFTRTTMAKSKIPFKNEFYLFMSQQKIQTGDFTFAFKTQNTQIAILGQIAKTKFHISQRKVLWALMRLHNSNLQL